MNDFKVGDPVEYVGPNEDIRALSPFIIARLCGSGETRYVKIKGFDRWEPLVRNLRHVTPAPDVIAINRADLPEVVERGGVLSAGSGPEECVARGSENPNWLRNRANSNLALADFIEAREKAAEEAEHTRGRRRDELAAELAPRAYASLGANWYGNVGEPLQKAIDRIIELENKAHE